jgi:hypothetical protein
VAVNNWSLPTWVEGWDKVIGTTRGIFQDFSLSGRPSSAGRASHARSSNKYAISYVLPGELLAAILLDLKHIRMETQERYLTGPVELRKREGKSHIYPTSACRRICYPGKDPGPQNQRLCVARENHPDPETGKFLPQ